MEANHDNFSQETFKATTPTEETKPNSHHTPPIKLIGILAIIAVLGSVVFLFLQNQSLKAQMGLPTFKFPWSKVSCEYNGQTYGPGEGFPSDDGCNSCSCSENGEVACTLMACEDTNDQQMDQNPAQPFPLRSDNGVFKYQENGISFSFSDMPGLDVSNCNNTIPGLLLNMYDALHQEKFAGLCVDGTEGPRGISINQYNDFNDSSDFCPYSDNPYMDTNREIVTFNEHEIVICTSARNNLPYPTDNPYTPYDDIQNISKTATVSNILNGSTYVITITDEHLLPIFEQILTTLELTP